MKNLLSVVSLLLFMTTIVSAAPTVDHDKKKIRKKKKEDLTLYKADHLVTIRGTKKDAADGDVICKRSRKMCIQVVVAEPIKIKELSLMDNGSSQTNTGTVLSGKEAKINIFDEEGTKVERKLFVSSYEVSRTEDKTEGEVFRISFDEGVKALALGNITVKGKAKMIQDAPGSQLIRCKGRKGECVTGVSTEINTKWELSRRAEDGGGSIVPGGSPSINGLEGEGGVFTVNLEKEQKKIKAKSFSVKEVEEKDGPVVEIRIIESK